MSDVNTHGMVCDFGKHKGTPYTRLPVSYLKWMVGCRHSRADIAQAELDRRGTVTPDLDISGHAIDRASLNSRKVWHETRGEDEGLHAWLVRISGEALALNDVDDKGRFHWRSANKPEWGVRLAFDQDGVWPVLKTVLPLRSRGGEDE